MHYVRDDTQTIVTTEATFTDPIVLLSSPQSKADGRRRLQSQHSHPSSALMSVSHDMGGRVTFTLQLEPYNDTYCEKPWSTPILRAPSNVTWLVVEQGAYNIGGFTFFAGKGVVGRKNYNPFDGENYHRIDYPTGCVHDDESCYYTHDNIGVLATVQTRYNRRLLIPRVTQVARDYAVYFLQPYHDSRICAFYTLPLPEVVGYLSFELNMQLPCANLAMESHKLNAVTSSGVDVPLLYSFASTPGVFGTIGSMYPDDPDVISLSLIATRMSVSAMAVEDQCYDDETVHSSFETAYMLVMGALPPNSGNNLRCSVVFTSEPPVPTMSPTLQPTAVPTTSPTLSPTLSHAPTITCQPTSIPTAVPSGSPSSLPTAVPTLQPTISQAPTVSSMPTSVPSSLPTQLPTSTPTATPTSLPTPIPSSVPTLTYSPTISASPTISPTFLPTLHPTGEPTLNPTMSPTISFQPTLTFKPTQLPSFKPTMLPTLHPTLHPTLSPTMSHQPTLSFEPTSSPTAVPSASPSAHPTCVPTLSPTVSYAPTFSVKPTSVPTRLPTLFPTSKPTVFPTFSPTLFPTYSDSAVGGALCAMIAASNMADLAAEGRVTGWTCTNNVPNTGGKHICEAGWTGLLCDVHYNLVGIDMSGLGLTGFLPAAMGAMTGATGLNLARNHFNGPMPDSLSQLKNMANFNIAGNNFGSSARRRLQSSDAAHVPAVLGNMSALTVLDIAGNGFTGPLPAFLCDLPLTTLLTIDGSENDNQFSCVSRCLLQNPPADFLYDTNLLSCETDPPSFAPSSAPTEDVQQQSTGVAQLSAAAQYSMIGAGILIVLVCLFGYWYFRSTSQKKKEEAFDNYILHNLQRLDDQKKAASVHSSQSSERKLSEDEGEGEEEDDDYFDITIANEFPLELMNEPTPVADEPSRDSISATSLLNPDDYSATQSTLSRSTSAYTSSSMPIIHAADRGMYFRYPDDSSQARDSVTDSSYISGEVGVTVHDAGDSETEVMDDEIHELGSFDEEMEHPENRSEGRNVVQRSSTIDEIRSYSQQSVGDSQPSISGADEVSEASERTNQSLQRLTTMQELLLAQQTPLPAPSTPNNTQNKDEFESEHEIMPVDESNVFSPSLARPPTSSISTVTRPPRPIQPNSFPDPRLTESSDSRRDATIHTESSQASDEQHLVVRNDVFDL